MVASLAVPFQITFQSLKQSLGRERGFPWDSDLAALDSAIHGGPAWHWYAFLLDRPVVLKSVAHFVRRVVPGARRSLRLAVLVSDAPAAPARPDRSADVVDCRRELWGRGHSPARGRATGPQRTLTLPRCSRGWMPRVPALIATANQRRVWAGFQSDQWLPFGGISAMPSLHVGLSVLIAIIAWQRSRPIGLALWMCAAIMQIGSVILGWHYGIDGYAGAGAAYVAWVVAGATQAQWGGISLTGSRDRNACERDATRDGPPQPFGQLRTTSRRWE